MNNHFIKIANSDIAISLAGRGFQYIKEQDFYAFPYSEEIEAIIKNEFPKEVYIKESKLRF